MLPVLITETAIADLKTMAAVGLPCESGGILVGVKARRTVWIVGAIELLGDNSPGHYTVPKGATHNAVLQARETIDPRVGYVGDWHSHTDGAGPTSTDRAVMRTIAWFVTPPTWRGPCFLLLRRSETGFAVDGYRASFPRLVPVDLLPTGPLASIPDVSV